MVSGGLLIHIDQHILDHDLQGNVLVVLPDDGLDLDPSHLEGLIPIHVCALVLFWLNKNSMVN